MKCYSVQIYFLFPVSNVFFCKLMGRLRDSIEVIEVIEVAVFFLSVIAGNREHSSS